MSGTLRTVVKFATKPAMWKRKRYLFIIGHMRSYSTLFSHLLGTHEAICGYAEMHQGYTKRIDLWRLFLRLEQDELHPEQSQILLDKVLHSRYRIATKVLLRPDVHVIFVIRSPEATIRSILNMQQKLTKRKKPIHEDEVVDYYCGQLRYIAQTALLLKTRALFVDADRIVDESETLLQSVQRFLGLSQPFLSEYRLFRHTGQKGYGDPSEKIRSGKIEREKNDYSEIVLDAVNLQRAQKQYMECIATLRTHSLVALDQGVTDSKKGRQWQ